MVDVGEGKFLNVIVHSLSDVFRETCGRDGCLPGGKSSAEQGRKGYQKHHQSHFYHIIYVAGLQAVIDDRRHQHGDDHFKYNLEDDENRR